MIAQERKAIRCGTMQQFGTMVNSNVHVHNRQDSGICMKKMEVNGRTE